MPVYYTGAQKPAKLASLPASFVLADECEKITARFKDEADPLSLAMERTKSYSDSLVILASTPTTEETKFNQLYLEGTQSHFFCPCPHCGKEMQFIWDRESVVWEEGQPKTARLVCPHCKEKIDDTQRRAMMSKGRWIDDNPDAREQGRLSFQLSTLYSPFVTLGECAQKYHDACHSIMKESELQNFTQSWLGLPWTQYLSKIYDEDVQACIDPEMHRGVLPDDYKLLVFGADVGLTKSYWSVTAICEDGTFRVIDYGTVMDITTTPNNVGLSQVFDSLVYRNRAGDEFRPDLGFVDSGYRTTEVYEELMRCQIPGTMMPTRGTDNRISAWSKTAIRTMPEAPFELHLYSDFHLKAKLYCDLIKNQKLKFPAEADDEYIHSFCGQEMQRRSNGKLYFKDIAYDDFGDSVKVAVLANWELGAELSTNPLVQATLQPT